MKSDMTIAAFITALRAKAKSYNEQADSLERNWSAIAAEIAPAMSATPAPHSQELNRPVSVEELKAAMAEKKGRAKHFAQRMGTSEAVILALVRDPANMIDDSDRGWLKLKPYFE